MVQLFVRLQTLLGAKNDNEQGATMVEYGLMLALIAVVCLGAVAAIGTNATGIFQNIADKLTAAA